MQGNPFLLSARRWKAVRRSTRRDLAIPVQESASPDSPSTLDPRSRGNEGGGSQLLTICFDEEMRIEGGSANGGAAATGESAALAARGENLTACEPASTALLHTGISVWSRPIFTHSLERQPARFPGVEVCRLPGSRSTVPPFHRSSRQLLLLWSFGGAGEGFVSSISVSNRSATQSHLSRLIDRFCGRAVIGPGLWPLPEWPKADKSTTEPSAAAGLWRRFRRPFLARRHAIDKSSLPHIIRVKLGFGLRSPPLQPVLQQSADDERTRNRRYAYAW